MKEVIGIVKAECRRGEVETTLLGSPPYRMEGGRLCAMIPDEMQAYAESHGLKIIGADLKRGTYIVSAKP